MFLGKRRAEQQAMPCLCFSSAHSQCRIGEDFFKLSERIEGERASRDDAVSELSQQLQSLIAERSGSEDALASKLSGELQHLRAQLDAETTDRVHEDEAIVHAVNVRSCMAVMWSQLSLQLMSRIADHAAPVAALLCIAICKWIQMWASCTRGCTTCSRACPLCRSTLALCKKVCASLVNEWSTIEESWSGVNILQGVPHWHEVRQDHWRGDHGDM